jgi:triosephosphate isomerase
MADTPRPLVAGNWKMNGLRGSSAELTKIMGGAPEVAPRTDLMVCPPTTLLAAFASLVQGTPVMIGAQDCHAEPSPAPWQSSSAIPSAGSIIARPTSR